MFHARVEMLRLQKNYARNVSRQFGLDTPRDFVCLSTVTSCTSEWFFQSVDRKSRYDRGLLRLTGGLDRVPRRATADPVKTWWRKLGRRGREWHFGALTELHRQYDRWCHPRHSDRNWRCVTRPRFYQGQCCSYNLPLLPPRLTAMQFQAASLSPGNALLP